MRRLLLPLAMLLTLPARAQQSPEQRSTPADPSMTAVQGKPVLQDTLPLPDIRQLILDVDRNERAAEAARRDYTYHLHIEQRELDSHDELKKTETTDAESFTLKGVRVNRVVARNGKPLTAGETSKESDRLDKEVEKDLARRGKREDKGEATDSRGDELITASRILELGSFTNPRRVLLDGRSTIVADYAGDKAAKTHGPAEGIIRDLVGTVWFDEADHVLVRGEGHFLNDFKIAGGLVLDIHKGFSFSFQTGKIQGEAWLPVSIAASGSARYLLFGSIHGTLHLTASDYRKFHVSSSIIATHGVLDEDGNPVPAPSSDPRSPSAPKP